jgi:localization factor PodJL
MDFDSTWHIDGVEPEAREAAKLAARKAGLPLGGWLTQTILGAAANELRKGLQSPEPQQQLSAETLDQRTLVESIQKLTERIETTEAKMAESIAPLARTVNQLSEQLEEVKAGTATSSAPVERALTRLNERLEKLEDRARSRGARRGLFFR